MLQNSSLMESSCPFIADRLAAMKMESVQPYELLTALPEASKQQFYRMAKFDYARFAGLFDLSPKKNLIIIGTSHSSAASEQQQAAYVERIIQQYGSDYDIFFKPHPADSSSAGYPDRFEGLTLLPGQMPFEIFVWALLDNLYLRTARQGGLPLCRRCRRTRPAAEHPFPRRRERGMDSVNAPGAEKRHPARVAFFSRKKIPRRSRGPGKQLFN